MLTNRGYSVLEVKEIDESGDKRIIKGMATTPTPDRMDDIVEPLGVEFKNPMPLLWQHRSSEPVGEVVFGKPTKNGIPFTATVAIIKEAGRLKDRIDEAWQSVKYNLVKAVSIGFRALEYQFMESGGIRFVRCEVMELSLVTIPANPDATINSIKSADASFLAASGLTDDKLKRPKPPASGIKSNGSKRVKILDTKETEMKTIAEQIAQFTATRVAKAARLQELITKSGTEGQTLDAAEGQEFEDLDSEIKEIDKHLARLERAKSINLGTAAPVAGADAPGASAARAPSTDVNKGAAQEIPGAHPVRVSVTPRAIPKGIGFARFVMAVARAKGNIMQAEQIALGNERWAAETPEVAASLKAAVAAGTTTDSAWASPLVQYENMASEFIEFVRPQTIIGRIPGLRYVPFKIKIPRQTGASSVNWVGEGKAKPLSGLAFDSVTLDIAKIAGIVVLTDELVKHSSPSAETLVRDDLAKAIIQFMDQQFVDPSKSADDVSPASITNGVTPVVASGTTAAALRADVATLLGTFLDSNLSLSDAVWITTQQLAMRISMLRTTLGAAEFPDITMNGGTLMSIPVIASEGVPATGNSPTDGFPLILAKASDILIADEGGVQIDASREASLQMESAPDSPATASTTLVSLFQHNMMAIRAEREVNWKKRRTDSVGYIASAKYTG